LHFFVAIPAHVTLGSLVGTLKRVVGKAVQRNDSRDPIWQRGFFDHLLQSAESYSQKWNYVRENPSSSPARRKRRCLAVRGRDRSYLL
jgi:hypothetical protein